jgi:hypothetical protein
VREKRGSGKPDSGLFGDNGKGLGASHPTGWTGLGTELLTA